MLLSSSGDMDIELYAEDFEGPKHLAYRKVIIHTNSIQNIMDTSINTNANSLQNQSEASLKPMTKHSKTIRNNVFKILTNNSNT